jgi:hypothetical protein
MRRKNMVMGPAWPETKNDCADEGQQQITRPEYTKGATRILLKSRQPDFQERKPENLLLNLHLAV